ncbi:hypothetical protein SNEBB_001938 [Seison nebaliae]|nr:hypothetical protein SNEBB_001938 [Seison nebaliae]
MNDFYLDLENYQRIRVSSAWHDDYLSRVLSKLNSSDSESTTYNLEENNQLTEESSEFKYESRFKRFSQNIYRKFSSFPSNIRKKLHRNLNNERKKHYLETKGRMKGRIISDINLETDISFSDDSTKNDTLPFTDSQSSEIIHINVNKKNDSWWKILDDNNNNNKMICGDENLKKEETCKNINNNNNNQNENQIRPKGHRKSRSIRSDRRINEIGGSVAETVSETSALTTLYSTAPYTRSANSRKSKKKTVKWKKILHVLSVLLTLSSLILSVSTIVKHAANKYKNSKYWDENASNYFAVIWLDQRRSYIELIRWKPIFQNKDFHSHIDRERALRNWLLNPKPSRFVKIIFNCKIGDVLRTHKHLVQFFKGYYNNVKECVSSLNNYIDRNLRRHSDLKILYDNRVATFYTMALDTEWLKLRSAWLRTETFTMIRTLVKVLGKSVNEINQHTIEIPVIEIGPYLSSLNDWITVNYKYDAFKERVKRILEGFAKYSCHEKNEKNAIACDELSHVDDTKGFDLIRILYNSKSVYNRWLTKLLHGKNLKNNFPPPYILRKLYRFEISIMENSKYYNVLSTQAQQVVLIKNVAPSEKPPKYYYFVESLYDLLDPHRNFTKRHFILPENLRKHPIIFATAFGMADILKLNHISCSTPEVFIQDYLLYLANREHNKINGVFMLFKRKELVIKDPCIFIKNSKYQIELNRSFLMKERNCSDHRTVKFKLRTYRHFYLVPDHNTSMEKCWKAVHPHFFPNLPNFCKMFNMKKEFNCTGTMKENYAYIADSYTTNKLILGVKFSAIISKFVSINSQSENDLHVISSKELKMQIWKQCFSHDFTDMKMYWKKRKSFICHSAIYLLWTMHALGYHNEERWKKVYFQRNKVTILSGPLAMDIHVQRYSGHFLPFPIFQSMTPQKYVYEPIFRFRLFFAHIFYALLIAMLIAITIVYLHARNGYIPGFPKKKKKFNYHSTRTISKMKNTVKIYFHKKWYRINNVTSSTTFQDLLNRVRRHFFTEWQPYCCHTHQVCQNVSNSLRNRCEFCNGFLEEKDFAISLNEKVWNIVRISSIQKFSFYPLSNYSSNHIFEKANIITSKRKTMETPIIKKIQRKKQLANELRMTSSICTNLNDSLVFTSTSKRKNCSKEVTKKKLFTYSVVKDNLRKINQMIHESESSCNLNKCISIDSGIYFGFL